MAASLTDRLIQMAGGTRERWERRLREEGRPDSESRVLLEAFGIVDPRLRRNGLVGIQVTGIPDADGLIDESTLRAEFVEVEDYRNPKPEGA